MTEQWIAVEEVTAARQRLVDAVPGFAQPDVHHLELTASSVGSVR